MANSKIKADSETALIARLGKKKKNKPASIQDVLAIVQEALETARDLLSETDPLLQLKACHGCFQGAMAYSKLFEVGEIEARLVALENNPVLTDRKEVQNGAFN
jgi:hypothetical protein